MAALAAEERPPQLNAMSMLPTEPFVLMQRIAANLPEELRTPLKTITLQESQALLSHASCDSPPK